MPRNTYLDSAAIELAALATFIRIGHMRDEDLQRSGLFTCISPFGSRAVMQGYVFACRPIVLDLVAAMQEKKFTGWMQVRELTDAFVAAMVDRKLTAEMIHKVIVEYAHPPS